MLLTAIVAVMWFLEAINSIDHDSLDTAAGIVPRNTGHVWAIFTAPFLHVSWTHLIDNTIPFVFMGVIIALWGAGRLALVTLIVIVVGGFGTWLVAPAQHQHRRRQRDRVRLRHLPVRARRLQPQRGSRS